MDIIFYLLPFFFSFFFPRERKCFFRANSNSTSIYLFRGFVSISFLRRVDAVYKDTKGDRLVLEHLQAGITTTAGVGKERKKEGKKRKGGKNVERREIMIMPVPIPFRSRQL